MLRESLQVVVILSIIAFCIYTVDYSKGKHSHIYKTAEKTYVIHIGD